MNVKKLTLNNFMLFENAEIDWAEKYQCYLWRKQYRKDNIA